MSDMLVKLYNVKEDHELLNELKKKGIYISRVLSPDKHNVLEFVRKNFNEGWASECDAALSNHPTTCYIAVKDKEIIGFACYDATAKDYFGPTGVSEAARGQRVGEALLKKCLCSMEEAGYAYAIIGGAKEAIGFYEKTVGATVIEDSYPGVYERLVRMDKRK